MSEFDIPEWHKKILDKRLKAIENGEEEFQDFNEALDEIEREL